VPAELAPEKAVAAFLVVEAFPAESVVWAILAEGFVA